MKAIVCQRYVGVVAWWGIEIPGGWAPMGETEEHHQAAIHSAALYNSGILRDYRFMPTTMYPSVSEMMA